MSAQRRTMTAALQTPELNDKELSFIRGDNVKNAVTRVAIAEPTESVQPPQPEASPPAATKAAAKGTLRVIPTTVGLSTRIPGELQERLMRASFDRKLTLQAPFTQQDIVTEALTAWLKKAGYP